MDSNPMISRILEPRPASDSASPAPGSDIALNDALASSLRVSDASVPITSATASPQIILEPKPPGTIATPGIGSTPRLRSSIACTRCRKSKIKCTNAGAGTTCEACAHSGRECVYPVPGTGGVKRDGEGEDSDRVKRSRVRKPEPIQGVTKVGFVPNFASPDHARVRFESENQYSQMSVKSSILQPSSLSENTWAEVFHLFQLHYGTELSFLHSPTFLPHLTESSALDPASTQLLKLGILTLTARHHDGLSQQYASQAMNGSHSYKLPGVVSEHFAETLKALLFSGDRAPATCLEQPSLVKIQTFLMLSLYEWSVRRGMPAWLYLGIAIRMAQVMELLSEDLDTPDINSTPLAGLLSLTTSRTALTSRQDPESSEAFVQEETVRRTVWSCFLLDKYLSHGISRPTTMDPEKVHVQMPCSEKAWTFGERVCTPFFNGICSQHRDRTRRKLEHSRRNNDEKGPIDPRVTFAEVENLTSRISCEYGQDEGLISRYIKLVDIWGAIAQWSYEGGKSSGTYAPPPWDDHSRYRNLGGELQKFMEQMPRSYRFTKANTQAHLTQHTWPSYTLLHTLYSVCRLVLLREFLPFAPTKVESPTHLDEIEIREPNLYNRNWYSSTLADLFKVAHDFLELLQTCKARSSFPTGPMMGFGIYLVSLIGVYSLHFPQMDTKGLVFGKDMDPSLLSDRQNRIIESVQILASMRGHLPMAELWFRTLHRAHRFYQQLNTQKPSNILHQSNPGAYPSDRISPSIESAGQAGALRNLDTVFLELGLPEDENVVFVLTKEESLPTTNGTAERISSPQFAWKPVNSPQTATRHMDPLDRPAPNLGPQTWAKAYQARGEPPEARKTSPAYDQPLSYTTPPSNTLPPLPSINAAVLNLPAFSQTPPPVPSLKSGQTQVLLSFSGEDLIIFLDAKDDKELAAIRSGWAHTHTFNGQVHKRVEGFRSSWFGLLWQWS